MMTVLDGNFKSLNPKVLKVDDKGKLTPKKAGKVKIKFSAYGLKAARQIIVKD
jgi:hypothetical protein